MAKAGWTDAYFHHDREGQRGKEKIAEEEEEGKEKKENFRGSHSKNQYFLPPVAGRPAGQIRWATIKRPAFYLENNKVVAISDCTTARGFGRTCYPGRSTNECLTRWSILTSLSHRLIHSSSVLTSERTEYSPFFFVITQTTFFFHPPQTQLRTTTTTTTTTSQLLAQSQTT